MRNAERMDQVFLAWSILAFGESNKYKPYDLNMPSAVPLRAHTHHYANDSPLTELGTVASQMIGRTLRMCYFTVNQIYCSPALRCIQSAHFIQKTCRSDYSCKINIEPGLFEFLGWYNNEMPEFLTNQETSDYGYDINANYKSVISLNDLKTKHLTESMADYYERSSKLIRSILKKHATPANINIIIVAHAPSIDSLSRQLLGRPLSLPKDLDPKTCGLAYLYCCLLLLEENKDKTWTILDRSVPNISYYEHSNRVDDITFNRA